jgi:hypothetical protein
MKSGFLVLLLCWSAVSLAQDIDIEYDKYRDVSKYATFSFGESEIITPKDEETMDEKKLHAWVREALTHELESKGLKKLDSAGDLSVSYLIGSTERSTVDNVGPLGGTPGVIAQPRSSMRDFNMGSFIIDMKDKSKNLIWRVNAETIMASSEESQRLINTIVEKGFKKYGKTVKRKKKK